MAHFPSSLQNPSRPLRQQRRRRQEEGEAITHEHTDLRPSLHSKKQLMKNNNSECDMHDKGGEWIRRALHQKAAKLKRRPTEEIRTSPSRSPRLSENAQNTENNYGWIAMCIQRQVVRNCIYEENHFLAKWWTQKCRWEIRLWWERSAAARWHTLRR